MTPLEFWVFSIAGLALWREILHRRGGPPLGWVVVEYMATLVALRVLAEVLWS